LGTDDPRRQVPSEAVNAVRSILETACDYSPPTCAPPPHCTTLVNAALLEAWRLKANDPDSEAAKWLYSGAPAGISRTPVSCGIFPDIGDEPDLPHESLVTDFGSFKNYSGVDDDEVAAQEIAHHIKQGHLLPFSSLDDLTSFLGGEAPILNKIGIISKTRSGITKKRMILDTNASNIKEASATYQRVLLPRLLDAIFQGLILFDKCTPEEDMEWFVLDFTEAFWQVPLHPAERRFFCAMIDTAGVRQYLVFLRTVQGSRSAPLTWARVAALVMRLTQSLFYPSRSAYIALWTTQSPPSGALRYNAAQL
jgi:hypothetical protein